MSDPVRMKEVRWLPYGKRDEDDSPCQGKKGKVTDIFQWFLWTLSTVFTYLLTFFSMRT